MNVAFRIAHQCFLLGGPVVFATVLAFATTKAYAQPWPNRPVRLVVPYAPGGGTDFTARVLAEALSKALGHNVIVDNRPGAGSTIGTEHVAKSSPDGYTFLYTTSTFSYSAGLYRSLRYDAVKDFTGVSLVATTPFVLVVNAAAPIRNVSDLVVYAKSKPGEVSYSSAGPGSAVHLAGALLGIVTKTDLMHVPYRAGGLAVAAVLSGEVTMGFASIDTVLAFIKAGKLRALSVSSRERLAVLPEVPTFVEVGTDYESIIWYGALAPAQTPPAIVDRMSSAVVVAMELPETREKFTRVGASPVAGGASAFTTYLRGDIEKWTRIIREANIQLD